jgi:hypothetical protein
MKIPIQWAVGSHKGRSEKANGSRLVNLFAEALPQDSKSSVVLYGTPGTAVFSKLPTYPILGMQVMNNELYAVTNSNLYKVNKDGSYLDLGAIKITGRVSSATNGIDIVIVDGSHGYSYNKDNGIKVLGGDGWYPANTVTYQDGYFVFNRIGTGQFFLSKLLSTEFDALDYASAEGAPDDTVAVISDHRELWVFGERSTEVWYNSGDPDFPFERMQGAFVERGIAAAHSAAKIDNSVFWLGDDRIIYRANGYLPQRISTHAVEYSIRSGKVDDAFSYTYDDEGHKFYLITFPSQNITWCFDVSTGLWHERSHYQWVRHHSNCYAKCFGRNLVGDFQNGYVYELSMNSMMDDSDPIVREAVSPPIHAMRNNISMSSFEIDMESGIGLTYGQGDDPQAMLSWSDDGGKTWSNEHWASIGKIGEYLTRVKWNRLGMFRQRQIKVVISDPVPVVFISAFAEVKGGRN